MASPFSFNGTPSADLLAGAFSGTSSGADTGFARFDGPGRGNVPDVSGSAGFFGEEDPTPAFTASTDAMRKSLEASAAMVEQNPQLALVYEGQKSKLDRVKRLYGIGYSAGLNDRNADDAWQLATAGLAGLKPGELDEDAYSDEYVRYISREALQRGQNVRALGQAQTAMDGAFRTGFSSMLGSFDKGVRERFAQTEGQMRLASLALRKGLQEWEGPDANGLRSDAMRSQILRKAGEYYARALVEPGLASFVSKPGELVAMAAETVGALGGTRKPNAMERFVNAVGQIRDGAISYYGDSNADALNGYGMREDGSTGKTRAYSVAEKALASHFARNVSAGRDVWDMTDSEQLRADVVEGLTGLAPTLARSDDGLAALGKAADCIVSQVGNTHRIDFSKLTDLYSNPDAPKPESPFSFQTTQGYADVTGLAEGLANEVIGNRGVFSRNWGFGEKKAHYTLEGVSALVSKQLEGIREKYGDQYFKDNRQLLEDLHKTATEYLLSANTMADKWVAGGGNVREYADGLRDRFSAVFLANELRRVTVGGKPVLEGSFVPKSVSSRDEDLRGTGKSNRYATYGGLLELVKSRISPTTGGLSPEDQAGQDILNSIAAGLQKRIDAGYETGWFDNGPESNAVMMKADRLNREADALLGIRNGSFDVNLMQMFADGKALRAKAATPKVLADANDMPKAVALQQLVNAVFSDALNPNLARRARNWAANRVDAYGAQLTAAQREQFATQLAPAALDAMDSVASERLDRTGQVVDPRVWDSDDTLFAEIDRRLAKTLTRVKTANDNTVAARLQQRLAQEQASGQLKNQLAIEKQNMQ